LKPVVSLTHVLILKTTVGGTPWAFIASKQIYASHYLNRSLGLTVLSEDSADQANTATSVAYFNRSMTDGLRSWFASFERSIIDRRVRTGMGERICPDERRAGEGPIANGDENIFGRSVPLLTRGAT